MKIIERFLGYLNDKRNKKHEIKKLKAKNSKEFSWNTFWVSTFAIIAIFLICIVFTFAFYLSRATDGLFNLANNNPEVPLAYFMSDSMDEEGVIAAVMLSELKQLSISGNTDGNFEGMWTTKTVRELQKKDLTCVDEYVYWRINSSDITLNEQMKDKSCKSYAESDVVKFYKCPLNNCEMIETTREQVDEFIPKSISITNINVKGGKGA